MSAVASDSVGTPRTKNRNLTPDESLARKVQAEKIVFERVLETGNITGTLDDLRDQLRLGGMSNRLFRRVCRSLSGTENSFGNERLLVLTSVREDERGWRRNESRSYRLTIIE